MKENTLDKITLEKLVELLQTKREHLLTVWREQVRVLPTAKPLDTPTLNDHIPQLLDELLAAFTLKSDEKISESLVDGSPTTHGFQRAQDGFDIEEVVSEYNILRGCIHDLADAAGLSLQGKPFRIMNRVFDQSIGLAVQTYASQRALEVRRRREEYLSFIVHDLRTPLNAIAVANKLLERTVTEEKNGANSIYVLKGSRRAIQQLSEMVEEILKENVSLLTEMGITLEKRIFELWPLVESLIEDMGPLAGANQTELSNEVPHGLLVPADSSLIRRVFQNLISNAIGYTPGGKVTIAARENEEQEIECSVSDNGAGIPEDRIAFVFDKLETDPEKDDGLGLGLAIVKTFVEAHKGKVSVESTEGIGSKFQFTLPSEAADRY